MKKTFFILMLTMFFSTMLNAQVLKDTIHLSTIEIKDSLLIKVPYIRYDMSKSQIQTMATRDVGDMLRSVSNVSGIRKGGSSIDPVVRGFKFSQLNVILNNGIKIENGCPNRMDPVAAHVEAEDIDRIQIIKGPFVLRYGPSFGGIINLVQETPHPYEKFEIHANALYGFETNWNGQKEHLSINGGNRFIYFLLSGGYRDYGNYHSGKIDGEDSLFQSSFRKFNYNAKLGFTIKKKHNLMISYSGVHGRDVMYPALPMDEKSDDTWYGSVDYNVKDLSETIKSLDVKVYRSDVDHLMDNSHRPAWSSKQMVARVNAQNTGGRAELGMQFKKHKLFVGADYEYIFKDGDRNMTMIMMEIPTTKTTNLWLNSNIQNTGLFSEYKTSFSSFELNAALRFDYNIADSEDTLQIIKDGIEYFNETASQYFNVGASVGVTKYFNNGLSISLALAHASRSPNMLERYVKLMAVGYDNYDYLGDPQLKPETNNEIDLTFKFEKEKVGGFYLNGFYSLVQDYISSVLLPPSVVKPQTAGVLGVKQYVNTDFAAFTGFEFGYNTPDKYKFGANVIAAYTYAYTKDVNKYIVTGNTVTGDTLLKTDALSEIPPFEGTLNVYYKFLKGTLIPKLTIRAVADQNHVSEAFYEQKTPGFALMNFSITYKLLRYAEFNAGVTNIFNTAYYEHLNRKIIGTTGKLYEPGRVFFITVKVMI